MKKSLSFGLNRVSPESYNGWSGPLQGCWNDASMTASRLYTAGYESRALFDEHCTLDRARTELTAAANLLVDGDAFVFSNSGHGSQSPAPLVGTEEGLCLWDGILLDSEFRFLLSQFKPGVNVVVILDICHAGGLDRAFSPVQRVKVAPLFVTRKMGGVSKAPAYITANMLILASCLRDETSLDGDGNGAFTGSLLNTLVEGMTWRGSMVATSRYMSEHFPQQHPELIVLGGAGLEDAQI